MHTLPIFVEYTYSFNTSLNSTDLFTHIYTDLNWILHLCISRINVNCVQYHTYAFTTVRDKSHNIIDNASEHSTKLKHWLLYYRMIWHYMYVLFSASLVICLFPLPLRPLTQSWNIYQDENMTWHPIYNVIINLATHNSLFSSLGPH